MKKIIYILITLALFSSCRMGDLVDASKSNSYFKKSGEIFYSPHGNWFELGYDKCSADAKTFEVLAEAIAKDKNSIFFGYKTQKQVDHSSFVIDANNVPKDDDHVYEISARKELIPVRIKGIDVKSFEFIGQGRYSAYGWAKDKNRYYFKAEVVPVDYESLEFVADDFFYDKDSLYTDLGDWKIKTIKAVTGPIEQISKEYIKDGNTFYHVGTDENRKIELKTIAFEKEVEDVQVIVDKVIIVDAHIVYYGELFSEGDAKTFEVVSDTQFGDYMKFYKDKNSVYLDREKIVNANPKTFRVHKYGYSADDKNVFYRTELLEGVDASSFKEDENSFMQWVDDKGNRFDSDGKRVK